MPRVPQELHEVVRAFAAFLVFFSILRYLEDYDSVRVLASTLKTATPITLNFMAGAIPGQPPGPCLDSGGVPLGRG